MYRRFTHMFVLAVVAGVVGAAPELAQAANPQQITYNSAKVLVPGPFVHGPNTQLYINARVAGWKGRVTFINSDCPGAAELGLIPKYAYRVYGRKQILTSTCVAPGDFSDPLKLVSREQQALYRRLKRKARTRACKFVARAAKKGQKGRERVRVPCNRVKAVDSNAGRTVLEYYGSGRSHSKLYQVVLASDARLILKWRDGSERTYLNRQM